MKKRVSGLLLFIIALAMAFGLTGCGLKGLLSRIEKERETTVEEERQTESDRKPEKPTESDREPVQSETNGKYASMEEYVNSDEVQEVLNTLKGQMSGTGMSIEITADGDKMVYTYTYDSIEKADGMAESLESAMAAEDATFQSTADEIKKEVNAEKVSIVIRYVDMNGVEIYSKEYVAK